MRRIGSIIVALAVVVTVPGAVAQQQPEPQQQAQGQEPLAAVPAVLVLPFTMLGADAKHEWIGQGIQQNVQAELGRAGLDVVGTVQVKPMNRAPVIVRPEDEADAALRMASEAKADVVIHGNYQVVDQTVRITGQVTDVASGQTVGFIKADGTLRDLLSLEDQLATQALNFFQLVEPGTQPQQQEVATQAIEPAVALQEPVIYDPVPAETTVVYSPRYYDDDIDDYDWIGAATYAYPTYYPVGYYYPSYSYYYKPYCYRPWYYSSFSIGFHYGKHYGHYGHYYHYRDRHYRHADWHRDDDHRHRYASRDHYYGWRGDGRDRGPRFRVGDGDWRSGTRDARERSDRRAALAVDRRGDENDLKQEARVIRYRNVSDDNGKPRYVASRGVGSASERRMPEIGPPTRRDALIDKSKEAVRPRVASRDDANKRVITVPNRNVREPVVKRTEEPTTSRPERDRAARLVNPASVKNDRPATPPRAEPDRAAQLLGKDASNAGRTTARSDPDRAAQIMRGSERSSSSSSANSKASVRRSDPAPSRSATSVRQPSSTTSRSALGSPAASDRSSASIRSRASSGRSSALSRPSSASRSSNISSRAAAGGSSFRSSSSAGSSARSSGSSSRSSGRSSSSGRSGR